MAKEAEEGKRPEDKLDSLGNVVAAWPWSSFVAEFLRVTS